MQFIDGLSSNVDSSCDAVNSNYPECVHILAFEQIVHGSIDGIYDIAPEAEFYGMHTYYMTDSDNNAPTDHTYTCALKLECVVSCFRVQPTF